jgi:hypothetical protein
MLAPYFRVAEIRAEPGRHEHGGRPVPIARQGETSPRPIALQLEPAEHSSAEK